MRDNLRIDGERLMRRLDELARIGALEGGGNCRLAFSDEDKAGRDLVVGWMREAGLTVSIDRFGNVTGTRPGAEAGPPVMAGSHTDTVATGGKYDGTLGVLGALEVIETLNDAGITTRRPLAVTLFSNEEGARFAPDMMGSQVYQGGLSLDEANAIEGIDGTTVGENLRRIDYVGDAPVGEPNACAFVEIHVEQGPILENEGKTIGAVDGVQGISWREYVIEGSSAHAGTTPMAARRDAGLAAARIVAMLEDIATSVGHGQVATAGVIEVEPNLVNVVPHRAKITADLRNADSELLKKAESRLDEAVQTVSQRYGVRVQQRELARFEPTPFDPDMVGRIEKTAERLELPVRRLTSGAGHDAQIMARVSPTAMIFVPSVDGISHNIEEFTHASDCEAGVNVLLHTLLDLAEEAA